MNSSYVLKRIVAQVIDYFLLTSLTTFIPLMVSMYMLPTPANGHPSQHRGKKHVAASDDHKAAAKKTSKDVQNEGELVAGDGSPSTNVAEKKADDVEVENPKKIDETAEERAERFQEEAEFKNIGLAHLFVYPLFSLGSTVGVVALYGICLGLTGRTPGKAIMFLKVTQGNGRPPGIATGIVREVVKGVSCMFFFGMLYALQGLITGHKTFYDDWLNLNVEDHWPFGLTETQKNWRAYHRKNKGGWG